MPPEPLRPSIKTPSDIVRRLIDIEVDNTILRSKILDLAQERLKLLRVLGAWHLVAENATPTTKDG